MLFLTPRNHLILITYFSYTPCPKEFAFFAVILNVAGGCDPQRLVKCLSERRRSCPAFLQGLRRQAKNLLAI